MKIVDIDTHQEVARTVHLEKEKKMTRRYSNLRWDRIIGAVVIVLALIFGAVQVFNETDPEVKETKTITVMYRVTEVDTLWSIVKDLMGEKVNAQQVIYQIQQDNHINDTLPVGQVIKIRMPRQ